MQILNNKTTRYSNQPGIMPWKAVPDGIRNTLTARGCTLLSHQKKQPSLQHIRFQYAAFSYEGDLYYLQKWSRDEWGVSPSEVIFPEGATCRIDVLSNGNLLSLLVKKAVAKLYGHCPDNSPFQKSSSNRRYTPDKVLQLAG